MGRKLDYERANRRQQPQGVPAPLDLVWWLTVNPGATKVCGGCGERVGRGVDFAFRSVDREVRCLVCADGFELRESKRYRQSKAGGEAHRPKKPKVAGSVPETVGEYMGLEREGGWNVAVLKSGSSSARRRRRRDEAKAAAGWSPERAVALNANWMTAEQQAVALAVYRKMVRD